MTRIIRIKSGLAKNKFINSLIRAEILKYLRLNLSEDVSKKWDNYFKNTLQINMTCNGLLSLMVNTLNFNVNDNGYLIEVDRYTNVDGSKYTIDQLCRLINYGNLEIKGELLITRSLDYIERNIGMIIFKRLGVLV